MGTFAAIYSRIRHDPEGRQAGVERQEQDCRRMAAERGWTVLDPVYRENDTSASTKSRTRRTVFERHCKGRTDPPAAGPDEGAVGPGRRHGPCT